MVTVTESAIGIGSGRRSDFLGAVIFDDKASLTYLTIPDISYPRMDR